MCWWVIERHWQGLYVIVSHGRHDVWCMIDILVIVAINDAVYYVKHYNMMSIYAAWSLQELLIVCITLHHLTCGISSLLHYVNLILFTLLLVHLILRISPYHSHHLRSHHLSLPLPFTPDLKLISFTNPFLHSHSYSFRTDFTDLNLYWIKGALFVCFSFWLRVSIGCVLSCQFYNKIELKKWIARLSCILGFWVHVKLFYRIVSYRIVLHDVCGRCCSCYVNNNDILFSWWMCVSL